MGLMAASGHNGMKSRRIVEFLHAQVGQLINVHEVQHGQKEESPKSKWRTMAMCFGESVLSNLTSQTPQARRSFGKTQEELIGIGREDGCATSGSEGYFSKQFSGVLHVNPRLVTLGIIGIMILLEQLLLPTVPSQQTNTKQIPLSVTANRHRATVKKMKSKTLR